MNGDSVEIGRPPLDDTLIRTTAEQVKTTARKAHRIEIALVFLAAMAMVAIAGFTGYNTHRLRDVNRNLTNLVETIEANQVAQQVYNEAHAMSTAESHGVLAHNISCMADFFAAFALGSGPPLPEKAVLDACFQPTRPPPAPKPLPSESKKK